MPTTQTTPPTTNGTTANTKKGYTLAEAHALIAKMRDANRG